MWKLWWVFSCWCHIDLLVGENMLSIFDILWFIYFLHVSVWNLNLDCCPKTLILYWKEHDPWCKRYMELYNELRENWERLYWDEGYSKKLAQDHANYESAEDDDGDFSPYRFASIVFLFSRLVHRCFLLGRI